MHNNTALPPSDSLVAHRVVNMTTVHMELTCDRTLSPSPDFFRKVAASNAPMAPLPLESACKKHGKHEKSMNI